MNKRTVFSLVLSVFLLSGINGLHAQSVKNIIKSTVNHFSGVDLTGTWQYKEVAVEFQTDNLLKKAGGKAAAASVEKNLNGQLAKIGLQPGLTTFTFNDDGTFTNTTNERNMSGTYSYDSETKYITLKYLGHVPVKAKVSGSGSKISLLFEASGLLSVATFIGSHSGVSAISGISSILNSYDGMMAGLELVKQ